MILSISVMTSPEVLFSANLSSNASNIPCGLSRLMGMLNALPTNLPNIILRSYVVGLDHPRSIGNQQYILLKLI